MIEKRNNRMTEPDKRMVLITRIFDAPRELVFKAWTDPAHLVHWYAPKACSIQFYKFEFQQGGTFQSCIQVPGGHDCWCKGVYLEIVAPERIVFSMAVTDEKGTLVDPVDVGMDPDWPRETIVAVTFEEYEGKTKLTLHQTVLESIAKRTGAHPSWLEMFDRLAGELAKTTASSVRAETY